jgi:hypothetical protein
MMRSSPSATDRGGIVDRDVQVELFPREALPGIPTPGREKGACEPRGLPALRKVISGGQTGVDRAALDAAMAYGIAAGGWCPKARIAEDGLIPRRYPLEETPSEKYSQRTTWNVRDADATLILTLGTLDGGSELTARIAEKLGKPCIVASLRGYPPMEPIRELFHLRAGGIVLNVAGPRESRSPGIYGRSFAFLAALFRGCQGGFGRVVAREPRLQ